MVAVNESRQLSAVELMCSPFYIAFDRESDLAMQRELKLTDLKGLPWILFSQQVNPTLYDAISERALELKVEPCERHYATSAEQAAQLVKSTGGVAFLTQQGAWRVAVDGITIRPLTEAGLQVKTVVTARNDAGRLVSEFVRALVRKVKGFGEPVQAKLPLAI
jgi:DNA-binding transcriptional LysR family regulator